MVRKIDKQLKMNRFSAKIPPEGMEKNEGYCVKTVSLFLFSIYFEATVYQDFSYLCN